MEPVYLISNIHRSGSSMMMRCLEAGGLIPVYDKESDSMNQHAPFDYIPNPNGFYQFQRDVTANFYEFFKGKVVKCPVRELLNLPVGNYKLCFIKRNPAEIRASMAKWTPFKSWGKDEVITYFYDLYVDSILTLLQARTDFNIVKLNYKNVVENPTLQFQKLVDAGWPVNVTEMTAKVQDSLYRNKLEIDGITGTK